MVFAVFYRYNPRPIMKKVQVERRDRNYWIKRSQSPQTLRGRDKSPCVGMYTPIPTTYDTF